MNRKDRRKQASEQRQYVKTVAGKDWRKLTPDEIARTPSRGPRPVAGFLNRQYLVQIYDESHKFPGMVRMSVNRAKIKASGTWADKITWDELQTIKRELGFGDSWGCEVYPPEKDVVNVTNMRHLWLFAVAPLRIGWFPGNAQINNPDEQS